MSITIQLNGDALTKLIELSGGNEFVLKLRQAVVEDVLGKYVKALSTDAIRKSQESVATDLVNKYIGKLEKDRFGSITAITTEPRLLEELTRQAQTVIDKAISNTKLNIETVAKATAEKFAETFGKRIETSINSKLERWTSSYIDEQIQQRLKAALKLQ